MLADDSGKPAEDATSEVREVGAQPPLPEPHPEEPPDAENGDVSRRVEGRTTCGWFIERVRKNAPVFEELAKEGIIR